ncbi:MAG: polysaccharide biosynthesis/export family protein [Limisphaerales bacterium]
MNLINRAAVPVNGVVWFLLASFWSFGVTGRAAEFQRSDQAPTLGGRPQLAEGIQPKGTATNSLSSANTSYTLLVNDLIKVEVYNEKDLERVTRVDQDGTISLPLIQTVRVAGRTVAEARAIIRGLYEKDYLVSAGVDISVVTSSQTNKVAELKKKVLKFTVSGEVKKPGVVEIPEGEKVNLVQAIALAGDFTTLANQKDVTIKREGVEKVYRENVQSMQRDSKSKPFEVLPGDVIVVRQTLF